MRQFNNTAIKDYVAKHGVYSVLAKGNDIFNDDRYKLLEINHDTQSAAYEVKSDSYGSYTVDVFNLSLIHI